MLYIVPAYLMLFAALTNSVCLNNASLFFLSFFNNIFHYRAMSSPEKYHLKITIIIIINLFVGNDLSVIKKIGTKRYRVTMLGVRNVPLIFFPGILS